MFHEGGIWKARTKISLQARDEESVCACVKARKWTGAWKSTALLSRNSTALKAWGHIAVLRTLRSMFNFCTFDAAITLSGRKNAETLSLPLGESPCLAKSHESLVIAPRIRTQCRGLQPAPSQPGAPRKVPPALQRFLTPAAFLGCYGTWSCTAEVTGCALMHKRVVIW